jgi:predicted short-subunit dehydrogenase-like oxidoreductase (DUF2520 family)
MAISSVTILGSGNLATHLAKALYAKNIRIAHVYSRQFRHAAVLAEKVGAVALDDLRQLTPADLIIVCISDTAIAETGHSLDRNSFVVHTSGSTPMDILSEKTHYGVFYPFQTFSKEVDVDFTGIPVFVEANTRENEMLLLELARKISGKAAVLSSERRLKLHLAAVFAGNFSNHMYAIAGEILKEADLPFEILSHLMQETVNKALLAGNPALVQTGPAVRKNFNILAKHKEILAGKSLWQKIYTFVSNSIMEMK